MDRTVHLEHPVQVDQVDLQGHLGQVDLQVQVEHRVLQEHQVLLVQVDQVDLQVKMYME